MNHEEQQITALVAVESSGENRLPEAVEKPQSYWGRVSARYTSIWKGLLLVLLLFAVLFMLLFSRAFTYDSLFCFLKDLQSVSSFVPSDYATVYATYEEGDHTALLYRGGIAFVNSGGIEVYSPDGQRLLDVSKAMEHPRAVASRKYLVVYDQGGTSFSITNSYAELFSGETEHPIYGAVVADTGHFALITASEQALSQVLLYDNNFNLIQRFQRASATVGVSVSHNGKRIALLGATADEGNVYSVVDIYRLGEKEPEARTSFVNEIPLALYFTDNKNYAVLTDSALRCMDVNGKIRAEEHYVGDVAGFIANENGALLAVEVDAIGAQNRILAMDSDGDVIYDSIFVGDARALALGAKEIFLLSEVGVTRIETENDTLATMGVEEGATDLFVLEQGKIRVVYPAKAEYLAFSA